MGIKVTLNSLTGKDYDNARNAGSWDWIIRRNDQEWVSAVQNTNNWPRRSEHRAVASGRCGWRADLQPYEHSLWMRSRPLPAPAMRLRGSRR